MKKLFLILALLGMVAVGCAEGGFGDKIDAPENIFFGLDKEFVAIAPDGSLSSVYCKAITPPTAEYQNDMFSGNASGRKIYVPMQSVQAYKKAPY